MIITLPDVLDIGAIKCRYFRLIEHCFKESIVAAFTLAVLTRNFQEVRVEKPGQLPLDVRLNSHGQLVQPRSQTVEPPGSRHRTEEP
jgi:hypothetical protein